MRLAAFAAVAAVALFACTSSKPGTCPPAGSASTAASSSSSAASSTSSSSSSASSASSTSSGSATSSGAASSSGSTSGSSSSSAGSSSGGSTTGCATTSSSSTGGACSCDVDAGIPDAGPPHGDGGIGQIQYVVVIVKENHTFDSYFTGFPGAESGALRARVPDGGTIARPVVPDGGIVCDVAHDHAHALSAYNDGFNNNFNAGSGCSDPNTPYYRYTEAQIPNYWAYARNFVLADRFFSTLLSSTTPGHFTTIAAQSPFYANSDSSQGCSIPQASRTPVDAYNRDTCNLRGAVDPCFSVPVITDAFPANLTWLAYGPKTSSGVATPFNFVPQVGGDATMRAAHYRDILDLVSDLQSGGQPNLLYANVDGPALLSEHPPVDVCPGENFTVDIVNAIMQGPHWNETAIIVTWDDWGGFYDHVPPPLERCEFTPGFRLPAILISPWVKPGYVLHTYTEHGSIPRFIEDVFGMPRMYARDHHARDDQAGSFLDAFDFTQVPLQPLILQDRVCP